MSGRLVFVSRSGVVWPFDGSVGVTVVDEDEGIFNVPVDLVIDPRVGSDGGSLVSARRSPRAVVLRLLLADAQGVLGLWGRLLRSFAEGGKLVYVNGGTPYELRQVTLSVPDRSMTGRDLAARVDDVFGLSLLALDPWWYGPTVSAEIDLSSLSSLSWSPEIGWSDPVPWNGGDSLPLSVEGDADAYPRFVVGGEVDAVTVGVDGVSWRWQRPLDADKVGEVDTRPGSRGPHLGSSLVPGAASSRVDWTLLDEQSRLVTLPTGQRSLVVGAEGAESGSFLRVVWEPRWAVPSGGTGGSGIMDDPPGSWLYPPGSFSLVEDPPGSGLYEMVPS